MIGQVFAESVRAVFFFFGIFSIEIALAQNSRSGPKPMVIKTSGTHLPKNV